MCQAKWREEWKTFKKNNIHEIGFFDKNAEMFFWQKTDLVNVLKTPIQTKGIDHKTFDAAQTASDGP